MDDNKEKNYWIKIGMPVRMKVLPELRMVVDNIQHKTKVLPKAEHGVEGLVRESQVSIVGVNCHWLDKEWRYQKGLFHTTELEKWI